MARHIGPQPHGATLDLRGPRDSTLTVIAPDGLTLIIPAPNGKATLWLPQAGDWTYAWPDGTAGTITVEPARTVDPAPAQPEFTGVRARRI